MTHTRTFVIQTLLLAVLVPALVAGQGGILPVNCTSGNTLNISAAGVVTCVALPSGSLPTGFIGMIVSGTCPAGTTEESSLNGKTLFGTLAANGDVGGTGGADTITPTVASLTAAAQTVNSLTAAAQTVNSLTAAAHTISWPANVPTNSGGAVNDHTTESAKDGTSGSAHTHLTGPVTHGFTQPTIAWPVNPPTMGTAAVTGTMNSSAVTGTMNSSAVTGTLNSFDNRSAFTKVIFCKGN